MKQYIYLIYRFITCSFLNEIVIFNVKINYLIFFFLNINAFKYILYLFDKDINPFKSKEFYEFTKLNKKKWKEFKKEIVVNNTKEPILIENFISHPVYTLGNVLIGKYLQLFRGSQCIGLLRKGDIRGEVLFRSYGIDKFYYYKTWSFFKRCKYIYKSILILKDIKNINEFCKIRIKKIDVGLLSYDSFLRYTRNPTAKKINSKLILSFAEALFASDFFEKFFYNKNISELVQAERHFLPLSVLFQKSLLKKNKVYSRCGLNLITIRKYTKFDQRYEERTTFSRKLFYEIYKNNKAKSIKLNDRYYKKLIKNKFYGAERGPDVLNPKSSNKNFISASKSDFCKMFNWDKKKKIATVFLHIQIDGNYKHGRRKLFLDNYSWANFTLETITKLKNINWVIKEHPHEYHYKTKFAFSLLVKDLEKKYDHIRWFPDNINPASLKELTDVAITSHGTVGVEYPSFGIPSIVAERSSYTGLGFTLEPKNITDYKNLLKRTHNINKLNKQKIDKAKVFLFIQNILLKNNFSIMPDSDISRRINVDDFWYQSKQSLKKFNLNKNQFRKMFEKQLHFKLRHTVNFDLFYIKNKIFSDY